MQAAATVGGQATIERLSDAALTRGPHSCETEDISIVDEGRKSAGAHLQACGVRFSVDHSEKRDYDIPERVCLLRGHWRGLVRGSMAGRAETIGYMARYSRADA